MNAWVLALLPAVIGVDYGWERKEDGSIVYIIQVEPEAVESMKTGAELVGALPPELRNITNYKIRLGRNVLPNHNKLPPEISNGTVIPPPSAFAAATGSQPLNGVQPQNGAGYATSNYANPQYGGTVAGQPAQGGLSTGSGGYATNSYGANGSNAGGYNGQPNGTAPAGGNPGFVNNNPNYSNPNYSNPNYSNPNYNGPNYSNPNYSNPNYNGNQQGVPNYQQQPAPQPAGTGGYVFNQATGTWGPPATATLPTGVIAPSGTTSTAGWNMTNPNGVGTPTYGAGTVNNPNYGTAPVLNSQVGQPTSPWVSSPSPGTNYNQPQPGAAGPVFGNPSPDFQVLARPLDGQQAQPFVNNGAAPAVNPAAQVQNRTNEPPSAHPNASGPAAPTPTAPPEKGYAMAAALIFLFMSIGFNLWCGWTTYNLRERYRSLLAERSPAY